MKDSISWILSATVSLGFACACRSAEPQLVNGSFESPATFFKVLYTGQSIPGWTVLGGTVDMIGSGVWQPSNGEMSLDMVGTPARGAIGQEVQFDSAGTYYLQFDLSRNPQIDYSTVQLGAWAKTESSGYIGLGLFQFSQENTLTNMLWERTGTAAFAVSPGTTTFIFAALTGGDGGSTAHWGGAALDNVQLLSGASPYASPLAPPAFTPPDALLGNYTTYDDVGPGGPSANLPEPGAPLLLILASLPSVTLAFLARTLRKAPRSLRCHS